MNTISPLIEAQATCDGLHRLMQKINEAATDIDKGGSSSYELLALIASANTCVTHLGTQLTLIETAPPEISNVHSIRRDEKPTNGASEHDLADDFDDAKISIAK